LFTCVANEDESRIEEVVKDIEDASAFARGWGGKEAIEERAAGI
jgi:hypothetical protein